MGKVKDKVTNFFDKSKEFDLLDAKQLRNKWLEELKPEEVPQHLVLILRDNWKKNLDLDYLFTPDLDDTGSFAKLMPYITFGLLIIILIKSFF